MSNNQPIYEKLKKKYHKTEPITNFKDLLDRAENIYKSRTAFKLKDKITKYTTLHTNNLKMI